MSLNDLLTAEAILPSMKVNSKKQALQELSEKAAQISGIAVREIFDALLQRERLGSTGVGNGIAIPHGKLAKAGRIFGVFARLERPIDFESLDGAPVDLMFLLIAPESAGADHLKALARTARSPARPGRHREAARDARSLGALHHAHPVAEFAARGLRRSRARPHFQARCA